MLRFDYHFLRGGLCEAAARGFRGRAGNPSSAARGGNSRGRFAASGFRRIASGGYRGGPDRPRAGRAANHSGGDGADSLACLSKGSYASIVFRLTIAPALFLSRAGRIRGKFTWGVEKKR